VTAGDLSIAVGGTATNPTVETGTLDEIAALHPPAGNWSNNSKKITALANGSGAQDAAAFGQIGTAVAVETARAEAAEEALAPLASPALTGTPTVNGQAILNYVGVFGTGTDGAVTLDGSTTYNGFSSLAGSTYTLTRDVQASGLTINNSVTLKTANFRVFCTGTITNNGTISNLGANAAGGTGGAAAASASLLSGRAGGNGGTGVSGAGGAGIGAPMGSAGGNGGTGVSGAAGAGGTASQTATVAANNILALPFAVIVGVINYQNLTTTQIGFGAGGGGGGSDVATNPGGGGGGGGGIIVLFAAAVVNNGTITAAGGNGAAGTGGNAGGGGGGAGGAILVYTLTAWTAGTTSVAGGTLGAGSGTGSGGNNGGAGLVLNSVI
jgi:hypothetical protein